MAQLFERTRTDYDPGILQELIEFDRNHPRRQLERRLIFEGIGPSHFYGQDILSAEHFNRRSFVHLNSLGRRMRVIVNELHGCMLLHRRVLGVVFLQPSTRTSSSFIAAMERLGGSVIPITQGVKYSSSVVKGENVPDTSETLTQYADALVFRTENAGDAALAAESADVPLINAGDGDGEHPTQALLDVFTIEEEQGHVDDLTITMVGDLWYGRTIHSLAKSMCNYDNVKLRFVSDQALRIPDDVRAYLRQRGAAFEEGEDFEAMVDGADVIYMTRIQSEHFKDEKELARVRGRYMFTPETLRILKPTTTIMHPLPRNEEISRDVDSDPRAAYFRQVRNGLYIRMAFLADILYERNGI